MKLIPLSKRGRNKGKYVAQVDNEDYEYLMQWNWCACKDLNTYYAVRKERVGDKQEFISMHRTIMKVTDPKKKVDHIDKNGLNCQKDNMRVCTHAQNMRNNRSRKNATSKYTGVSFYKKNGKWRSTIIVDGTQYSGGYHHIEENAARAYDDLARKYFGEFANLNFKEKAEEDCSPSA